MTGEDAAGRARTLLLRADNQLKAGKPEKALATLEEARGLELEERLRELVERRIESLRPLLEGSS